MVDFKIKGTKLPVIPLDTKFRCSHWQDYECNSEIIFYPVKNYVSYGYKSYKNEIYILAENEAYVGEHYFMFKESDIIKLAKENNMNKEIIGYKLKFDEYRKAALKICNTVANWENSLKNYDISVTQTRYINDLKEAGVLDLWFEPVHKFTEKVVSVGGKFDVVIKDNGIWHKNDDITQFVESLIQGNTIVGTSSSYGKFSATILDIVFSRTGCQYVETKLSDWKQVYETYKSMQ